MYFFTSTEVSIVVIGKIDKLCPPMVLTKTFKKAVGNGLWR